MKKYFFKTSAIFVVTAMIIAATAGCKKAPESLFVPPDFVFTAQAVTLPDDIGRDISSIQIIGDKLVFVSSSYTESTPENNFNSTYLSKMYTADLDGSNITMLTGYKPFVSVPQGRGVQSSSYISSARGDADGFLWVIEQWNAGKYDIPDDFNPEMNQFWEYDYQDLGNGISLRKLDITGTEVQSIELKEIFGEREWFYIYSFNFDGEGNSYFALENSDYNVGGMEIYVLDKEMNTKFVLTVDRWFDSLIRIPDGRVGYPAYRYDESSNSEIHEIQLIDVAAQEFGEGIPLPLPPNVYGDFLPGGGIYDIIINSYDSIYGYTFGEEEPVKLLTWLETDVSEGNIQNVMMMSEDTIICTNYLYDRVNYENNTRELLILTRVPYSELPERTVLTLATFDTYNIRSAVVQFNRSNPDYRIHVIDYSQYNTPEDWNAGVMRLSTELISGRVPDILCISSYRMNYKEYVAKDLLADLYQFIDSDPVYSRSSFVDNVFPAAEIDGGLYQVFPSFSINTLIGHPSVVGPEMGWNMEEFTSVLNANPQADMPLGQWLTKTNFLQAAISFAIDDYIDWAASKAHFDTPQFIQLLEFCNTFPDDIDYDNIDWDTYEWIDQNEAIATGRQIMIQTSLWGFDSILWNRSLFGGEVAFKGFPNETRNGNSLSVDFGLAIIDTSPYKEAAWSFVRTVLDPDWQRQNTWGMQTNKTAFDNAAKQAMEQDYGYVTSSRVISGDGSYIESSPESVKLTQADIDEILRVIASANGTAGWSMDQTIWEIINEEVSDYFSGAITAEVAAKGIQSRVSLLVSERS